MKHIKITVEGDGLAEPLVIERNVISWDMEVRNYPSKKPYLADAAPVQEWEVIGGSIRVSWDLKP